MSLGPKDREMLAAALAARADPPKSNVADVVKIGGASIATLLVSMGLNHSLYIYRIEQNTKTIESHETRIDLIEKDSIGFKKDVLAGINEATRAVSDGEESADKTLGIVQELKGRMDQIERPNTSSEKNGGRRP